MTFLQTSINPRDVTCHPVKVVKREEMNKVWLGKRF